MARFGPLMTVVDFFKPIVEFCLPITVSFLVIWLLLRPNRVLPQVATATLTHFNITDDTSNGTAATAAALISYNLAVDLSFRNPRSHLSIHYLDLAAVASYGGERLGASSDVLPVFAQRPKETAVVHALFQGTSSRPGQAASERFRNEVANGTVTLLVTVKSSFMYKVLFQKAVYYYDYECYLPFPVTHAGILEAVSIRDIACAPSRNNKLGM